MEFTLSTDTFTQENNFMGFDAHSIYDIVIIGGGPSGLTAAVYCMRKGMNAGILVKDMGGQVKDTAAVDNYLGYKHITGLELVDKFKAHVQQFGLAFEEGGVVQSISSGQIKKIHMEDGRVFQTRSVIITTGSKWRQLHVPGEEEFAGKGVAYCAICDAPFYKDKNVAVVGGGNNGLEATLDLLKGAKHVTLIQFLDKLTADAVLIDKLKEYNNYKVLYEHEVVEIAGNDKVEQINVKDRKTGKVTTVESDGIFIEIGLLPNSTFVKDLVKTNEIGEIIVDNACRTSEVGVFAAGDVTNVPYKQIIIAAGEGAKAALSACDYVNTSHF